MFDDATVSAVGFWFGTILQEEDLHVDLKVRVRQLITFEPAKDKPNSATIAAHVGILSSSVNSFHHFFSIRVPDLPLFNHCECYVLYSVVRLCLSFMCP